MTSLSQLPSINNVVGVRVWGFIAPMMFNRRRPLLEGIFAVPSAPRNCHNSHSRYCESDALDREIGPRHPVSSASLSIC